MPALQPACRRKHPRPASHRDRVPAATVFQQPQGARCELRQGLALAAIGGSNPRSTSGLSLASRFSPVSSEVTTCAAFCVWTFSCLGPVWPCTRRLGVRKGVRGNHPLDGSPSLFAHLFRGTLRVPFCYGGCAPPCPAPPLKRRAKLLCFAHLWIRR